jgi:hypothetical protein
MVNTQIYVLLIAVLFLYFLNCSDLFSDSNNEINKINSIEKLTEDSDYTLIYSLSVESCLGCNNDKIITINKFLSNKSKNYKVYYFFQENLNHGESKILAKKYDNGIILSKNNKNMQELLKLHETDIFILLNRKGKELYREKLHLIKDIDNTIFEKQELVISHPTELNKKNSLLFTASNIKIRNNFLFALDKMQNEISSFNLNDGKESYSISTPDTITNFFKILDKDEEWKWEYADDPEILNFCLDTNQIKVFYKVNSVELQFDTNLTNSVIDTNLFIYPNILVASYKNNDLISINHLQNESFDLNYEIMLKIENNYILAGSEKIESDFPFSEYPDSVSVLVLTDSKLNTLRPIVRKKKYKK